MKALFVVASTVGEFDRETLRLAAQAHSEACGFEFDICIVSPGEDITAAIARNDMSGIGCLAAVGGDGTVSAVAHELVGRGLALGIVPAGTGNLVARELGVPLAIGEAVALIARGGGLRRIDAMQIGDRTYLLNAGVGINAEVIDQTSRLGKSLFGRSAYVGTAVWKVLQARPQRFEVTVDDDTNVYNATDIAISNCGILARALNPNGPDIRADDGQVDVCILCMKTPLEYPWYYFLKRIAPGRVNKIIHEMPALKRVTIKSAAPVIVQADGDIIGNTPLTIEVLPKAVTVIVPTLRVS
ncbi:MAG: diacylglycerol kinase family protein [Kiritimatiellae bacterium]|nr:diacylglycerol kinase family protein [Kiritimatiellia bacterium]